jgi:hypothetical protein
MKAFPNPNNTQEGGMNLRDWFAGLAMQGLMANEKTEPDIRLICKVSYQMANQMMKERSNENNK